VAISDRVGQRCAADGEVGQLASLGDGPKMTPNPRHNAMGRRIEGGRPQKPL
jgi:hypothetical protein